MNQTHATEREALRVQLGLSVAELARRASISVDTVRSILGGKEGQATKVRAVDDALAKAAREQGMDAAVTRSTAAAHELAEEGLMEFEVGGNFGVSVVVRGPVANHAELEEAVLKLIQGMNAASRNDGRQD